MRLNENRPVAWAVLAICVLGSVIGFGGGSVAKDRAALVKQFNGTQTEAGTRTGMDAYLDRAAEQAKIMANEAMMLLGSDNETAKEMLGVAQTLSDSSDYDARYDAFVLLQNDSEVLYNSIMGTFDKTKTKDFKGAYDDFWEAENFVKRDPYRQAAADFNSELNAFPENLITSARGVKKLNSFGVD